MDKITYLTGAGASADAIPVVNDLVEGLRNFERALRKESYSPPHPLGEPRAVLSQKIKVLHETLGIQVTDGRGGMREKKLHSSIDTYAKKLFIIEKDSPPVHDKDSKFIELKILMSLYFSYEQMLNVDVRYDSFFATVLKDTSNELPQNIRIISWNYDSQFELALSTFKRNGTIEAAAKQLNVVSKYTHYKGAENDAFSIYKINGTANFVKSEEDYSIVKPRGGVGGALYHVVGEYKSWLEDPSKIRSGISFAWENEVVAGGNPTASPITDKAITSVQGSGTLVIIGYSFPLFNRAVDKKMFKKMRDLNTIYIQDKYPRTIKERLLSFTDLAGCKFHEVTDLDQFVFPSELTI
jgi:hypothetical protein